MSELGNAVYLGDTGTIVAYLDNDGKVFYMSEEQFTELANNGSIVIDGVTIPFEWKHIYLVRDNTDEVVADLKARLEALEAGTV